jgi:hypothetical protein
VERVKAQAAVDCSGVACGRRRGVGRSRVDGLKLSPYPGRVWWLGLENEGAGKWASWLGHTREREAGASRPWQLSAQEAG